MQQAKFPKESAIIALTVASAIQQQLDDMLSTYSDHMYARIGMAMGDISAGVVDGRTFRVFGSTVHFTQRLESICPQGRLACAAKYYDLLCKQIRHDMDGERCVTYLKGMGDVEYYTLCSLAAAKSIETYNSEV